MRTSIQNHCSKEILYERNTTTTNNTNIAMVTVDPILHFPLLLSNIPRGGLQNPLSSKAHWLLLIPILIFHFVREDDDAQKSGRTHPRSFISYTWRLRLKSTSLGVHSKVDFICPAANLLLEIICLPDNSKVCFRSHQTPEGEWSEFSFFYYLISSVSQVQNWPESCCVNI